MQNGEQAAAEAQKGVAKSAAPLETAQSSRPTAVTAFLRLVSLSLSEFG